MCGLHAAEVPTSEQALWRAFARELGALFQLIDDLLDGDGSVLRVGEEATRRLADDAAGRARERLASIPAQVAVLEGIVTGLAARTAGFPTARSHAVVKYGSSYAESGEGNAQAA